MKKIHRYLIEGIPRREEEGGIESREYLSVSKKWRDALESALREEFYPLRIKYVGERNIN